jgi:hypothetical protein
VLVRIAVGLNSANGILSWHFTSIDPATGLPPDDPMAGFLPPNRTPPEGEGSVAYTVMPKQGLASGAFLTNAATIVFDVNPPIATPVLTNRLDNTKPASQILALGTNQFGPFEVHWSGTDTASGIRDCAIYVSDSFGPFFPWVVNTTNTSAVFAGEPGHSYAFFSLARDNAGNLEDSPSRTDVTTVMPLFLSIDAVAMNVVLSWPTNSVGFVLERADALTHQADRRPVPQSPSIIGGQNVVTNDTLNPVRFYRLRKSAN